MQDVLGASRPLPAATLYVAKEIVTLDPARPTAAAGGPFVAPPV